MLSKFYAHIAWHPGNEEPPARSKFYQVFFPMFLGLHCSNALLDPAQTAQLALNISELKRLPILIVVPEEQLLAYVEEAKCSCDISSKLLTIGIHV